MIDYADDLRAERLRAVIRRAGVGARLQLFAGVRPLSPSFGSAEAQLVAELECADRFGTIVGNGVLELAGMRPDPSARVSASPTWFRFVDADGVGFIDGDIGTDLILSNSYIQATQPVVVESFTIREGNG